MTRFETTVAVAAAALIAVANSPAVAQRTERGQANLVVDGQTKDVPAEVKGTPARPGKSGTGPKATRAPKVQEPPKPIEPTFTATGEFEKSKDLARDSAIRAATEKLHKHLMEQDPPVTRMPTTKLVRKLLVESQEKFETENVSGPTGDEPVYRATVALKVEPHHIRELRSEERSSEALWVLAGLGGLAAVAAGFFKVDTWTKGYLTSWLVLGSVGAGALLTGLWWWAK